MNELVFTIVFFSLSIMDISSLFQCLYMVPVKSVLRLNPF